MTDDPLRALIRERGMKNLLLDLAAACEAEHPRLTAAADKSGAATVERFAYQANALFLRDMAKRVY